MKVDIKDIASKLHQDYRSSSIHIEDLIIESIIEALNPELERLTDEVISEMQELEHPEPRSKAEYDERYGIGEGE